MNTYLIDVAKGVKKADLVVKNGKFVNVYSREIYDAGVAISGDRIAATGDVDYTIGDNTIVIDAKGKYLLPGFVDGHIHPESTNLNIQQFAELLIKHGTTAVMTDIHEVGVVGGIQAIDAVLKEAESTPLKLYWIVPSHIPFSKGLETSGGEINSNVIKDLIKRNDAVGLSEVISAYILGENPDLLRSMDMTCAQRKSLQGHLPDAKGHDLQACVAAGIMSDHEALSLTEAVDRVRSGCHLMIREGSVAHSLRDLIKVLTEYHMDSTMCSIVTDDLNVIDAVDNGHLDQSLKIALSEGVDFITAVQMVTVNAARAFNLDSDTGSLAPGRLANLNITTGTDAQSFNIESVVSKGKLVVKGGNYIGKATEIKHDSVLLNTFKLKNKITAEDLCIRVDKNAKSVKVKAMKTLDYVPITLGIDATLKVADGIVQSNPTEDIAYIAMVERYGKNGNIGKAFMSGFNLKSGALASSMAHDNHNIIVMGTNLEDMAAAVNRIVELKGGQVVVNDGKVLSELPLPVLGILSDESAEDVCKMKKELNAQSKKLGCNIGFPFMFLSFIGLAAIPQFAVTDHGFVDVIKQAVINPIVKLLY